MAEPPWFSSLQWSVPITVEDARVLRGAIPQAAGLYCFTNYPGRLEHNTGVLYVGMARRSIQSRVQSYLTDPAAMMVLGRKGTVSSSLRHAGKVQLLMEILKRSGGIWVRWLPVVGPEIMERSLIAYLRPAYNTQFNPVEGMADLLED